MKFKSIIVSGDSKTKYFYFRVFHRHFVIRVYVCRYEYIFFMQSIFCQFFTFHVKKIFFVVELFFFLFIIVYG